MLTALFNASKKLSDKLIIHDKRMPNKKHKRIAGNKQYFLNRYGELNTISGNE
jgi:hypothetical protein